MYLQPVINPAKIRLSSVEMDLLKNADWILTKNAILQKAFALLEDVQQQIWTREAKQETMIISPKISRGENYGGLPWLMLDYPRNFSRGNIFAVRCFFWWGNYFSITLQLSGDYKKKYEASLVKHLDWWQQEDFFISNNDHEWEHAVTPASYRPVNEFSAAAFSKHVQERSFIKLAKTFSLEQWDNMAELLAAAHRGILKKLQD